MNGNNITNAMMRENTVKGYMEAVPELFVLWNFESPYQPNNPENIPAYTVLFHSSRNGRIYHLDENQYWQK